MKLRFVILAVAAIAFISLIAASLFLIGTSSGSLASTSTSPFREPPDTDAPGSKTKPRGGFPRSTTSPAPSYSTSEDDGDEGGQSGTANESAKTVFEQLLRADWIGNAHFPPILSVAQIAYTLDRWRLRHEFDNEQGVRKDRRSFRIFPLENGATHEPYQPHASVSAAAGRENVCNTPPPTTPNDDDYPRCRAPGINNVLFTQHTRWYCIFRDKLSAFSMRDRFCNKGTNEKIRYSSILQLRWDKLVLPRFLKEASVSEVVDVAAMSPAGGDPNTKDDGAGGVLIDPESKTAKKKNSLFLKGNSSLPGAAGGGTVVPHLLRDGRLCKWGAPADLTGEVGFETISSLDRLHREKRHDRGQADPEKVRTGVSYKSSDDPFWCNVWFNDPLGRLATCDANTPLHICLRSAVSAISQTAKESEEVALESAMLLRSEGKNHLGAAAPPEGGGGGSICWHDITGDKQAKLSRCAWLDAFGFYFTPGYWRARRIIDFHSRYYFAARVAASALFATAPAAAAAAEDDADGATNELRLLPPYISVHLRRGDYQHHCIKARKGSVKQFVTFSKSPVQRTSLFQATTAAAAARPAAGGTSPSSYTSSMIMRNAPLRSHSPSESDPSIPGCYPSLDDVERAFDHLAATTGIHNIFVATNTPHDLVEAGIVDPFDDGVDVFSKHAHRNVGLRSEIARRDKKVAAAKLLAAQQRRSGGGGGGGGGGHGAAASGTKKDKKTKEKKSRRRQWRAVVLPAQSAKLFFSGARGVDDVILEMALLSLGRVFLLNRFSTFSGTALEMAILRQHAAEDPKDWDNVVTW